MKTFDAGPWSHADGSAVDDDDRRLMTAEAKLGKFTRERQIERFTRVRLVLDSAFSMVGGWGARGNRLHPPRSREDET